MLLFWSAFFFFTCFGFNNVSFLHFFFQLLDFEFWNFPQMFSLTLCCCLLLLLVKQTLSIATFLDSSLILLQFSLSCYICFPCTRGGALMAHSKNISSHVIQISIGFQYGNICPTIGLCLSPPNLNFPQNIVVLI